MADIAIARRPMGYGARYPQLDRGQVFELTGQPNDEKLVRLGYCEVIPETYETSDCGRCGARFIDDATRAAHGRNKHIDRVLTPLEEDQRADREERQLQELAPLNMEKTEASQRGVGRVAQRRIAIPE